MIYFLTPVEGGEFIKINRKRSIRPKILIKNFIKQKLECVVVFKNGMVYDGFLLKWGYNPLRHKTLGGRRGGKQYYKLAISGAYKLNEETIL